VISARLVVQKILEAMESPLICRILNLLRLHQLESPQHGQRVSARDLSRPRELRGLLGITWALSTLFQPPISAFVKITSSVENMVHQELCSTPNGIRTRAATLKGWCPRPLDDGGLYYLHSSRCVVGLPGFEPGTSASRTQRATKLRYSPQRVAPQPDNPSRRTPTKPKN